MAYGSPPSGGPLFRVGAPLTRPLGAVVHLGRALALAAILLGLSGRPAPAAPYYALQDLGTLGGDYSYSFAFGLNDAGDVVGQSQTAFNQGYDPFLFHGGILRDLGTYGGQYNAARSVNAAGDVVGYSDFLDDLTSQAVLFYGDQMLDLGTLGGSSSDAWSLNDAGVIVGGSDTAGSASRHAFRYVHGRMTDLGTLMGDGGASEAFAVNPAGDAVGYSTVTDGLYHAFLFTRGQMRDLGTLGGDASEATALNGRGDVVGDATYSPDTYHVHAFLFHNGALHDLGTLGGEDSNAWGVNDAGTVVGDSAGADGSNRAFVWDEGRMTDLTSRLAGVAGWTLVSARAINRRGQIAGYGRTPSGVLHACLLTPIAVASVRLMLDSVRAGGVASGRVLFVLPVPERCVVTLESYDPDAAHISPARITVLPGTASVPFHVQTSKTGVSGPVTVCIRASLPGSGGSASLTVTP